MKRKYRTIKKTNYNEEIKYLPQYRYLFLGFIPIWKSLSYRYEVSLSLIPEYPVKNTWLDDLDFALSFIRVDIEKMKANSYYRIEKIPYN